MPDRSPCRFFLHLLQEIGFSSDVNTQFELWQDTRYISCRACVAKARVIPIRAVPSSFRDVPRAKTMVATGCYYSHAGRYECCIHYIHLLSIFLNFVMISSLFPAITYSKFIIIFCA